MDALIEERIIPASPTVIAVCRGSCDVQSDDQDNGQENGD